MKKKIFFMVLGTILISLAALVAAQAKTLEVTLHIRGLDPIEIEEYYYGFPVSYTLFTNYSVELYDLYVGNYTPIENYENGTFKAEILSEQNTILYEQYFEPIFMILTNPLTETDSDLVSLEFPYPKEAKYLRVYSGEEEKLFLDIQKLLCNNDGVCSDYENFYSCADCEWYMEEGLCIGYSDDYYCETDCYIDTDCDKANCNDGIRNQDETSVDSGGVCDNFCVSGVDGEEICENKGSILLRVRDFVGGIIDVSGFFSLIKE